MLAYIAQGVISRIGVDIHPVGRCFLVLCASKHTSQGALPTAPLAWGLPFAASLLPASLLALSSLRVVLQEERGRRTWSLCSLRLAACAQSVSFEVRSCAAQRSENIEGVRRTFWQKPACRNRAGKDSARVGSPSSTVPARCPTRPLACARTTSNCTLLLPAKCQHGCRS